MASKEIPASAENPKEILEEAKKYISRPEGVNKLLIVKGVGLVGASLLTFDEISKIPRGQASFDGLASKTALTIYAGGSLVEDIKNLKLSNVVYKKQSPPCK